MPTKVKKKTLKDQDQWDLFLDIQDINLLPWQGTNFCCLYSSVCHASDLSSAEVGPYSEPRTPPECGQAVTILCQRLNTTLHSLLSVTYITGINVSFCLLV
jgi:hypothetical protein